MAEDWLKRFRDFSRTVDYVDDKIFSDITSLLERTFHEAWRVDFFRVTMSGHSIRTAAGDLAALSTTWSKDGNQTDIQIADDQGRATTLTSYCFLHRKELWVKAMDDSKLIRHMDSSENLEDQWPGSAELPPLPPYSDYDGSESRTLVALPLVYGNRMFGTVSIEFRDAIPFSSRGKANAELLAQSLSRIVWLHETYRTQVRDTLQALEQLEFSCEEASDAFKRRRIFLASSGEESKGPVISTITNILRGEFSEDFDLDFWADDSSSGGINDQVRASIAAAEFGICYLSERSPDDPNRYFDNPNVLFEAGMFQMLHQLRDSAGDSDVARWVPVREPMELTTPLPFDIAGDRVLVVPRHLETGEVDTEKLAESFRGAIQDLVRALELD
jgi:hypothetical protein